MCFFSLKFTRLCATRFLSRSPTQFHFCSPFSRSSCCSRRFHLCEWATKHFQLHQRCTASKFSYRAFLHFLIAIKLILLCPHNQLEREECAKVGERKRRKKTSFNLPVVIFHGTSRSLDSLLWQLSRGESRTNIEKSSDSIARPNSEWLLCSSRQLH